MFAIKGRFKGRSIVLVWDEGVVSGDVMASIYMEAMTENRREGPVGGPYSQGRDILVKDSSSFLLMRGLFDDVELVSGVLSPLPSIPEGSVA